MPQKLAIGTTAGFLIDTLSSKILIKIIIMCLMPDLRSLHNQLGLTMSPWRDLKQMKILHEGNLILGPLFLCICSMYHFTILPPTNTLPSVTNPNQNDNSLKKCILALVSIKENLENIFWTEQGPKSWTCP